MGGSIIDSNFRVSITNYAFVSDGRAVFLIAVVVAMGVTVYEAPHTTRYIAGRCSFAYVLWLGLMVASVIVPYMVAFHTSKPGRGNQS